VRKNIQDQVTAIQIYCICAGWFVNFLTIGIKNRSFLKIEEYNYQF
jgi:hypothetical protein